ncbi:MAG TPA: MMPL family transporter [Dehalococcoidia bacterium]|nr:MMPL family transporter [Dehalococcoidia bacterium]
MPGIFSPEGLARFSARRPWVVGGLWVLLILAAFAGAGMMRIDDSDVENKDYESERVRAALETARGEEPAAENIIVVSESRTVDSPEFRDFVTKLTAEVRHTAGVAEATDYYESGEARLVSPDRRKTVITATLEGDPDDARETVGPLLDLVKESDGQSGFTVLTVGDGSLSAEISAVFEKDLQRSEIIGIPVALLVLLLVFGAAVAAGVPLALSFVAIFTAVGITGVASRFLPVGDVVMNMIVMIGLAVGIDYSLFIIERFREERARGLSKVDAIARAGGTASRAVLFSGITVIIALASLLIVPSTTFHGLSLGAVAAVIGAVLAALTLLPAALSLLGDRVNALHLPGRGTVKGEHSGEGFWGKVTGAVMAHPLIAIAASVTLLLAAAAPAAGIRLGFSGVSALPESLQSIRGFHVLDKDFGAGRLAPVDILVEGSLESTAVRNALNQLSASLSLDERFNGMLEPVAVPGGRYTFVQVHLRGDSIGTEAQEAVRALRERYLPEAFRGVDARVLVGGMTASSIDSIDSMKEYLPVVIGFVLALSFALLTLVFRSIVIPVKAIIMNLLSVGAAYGLLVAVFQEGFGASLLGFETVDTVVAWLPVFLFAVLFGLSMDYHVFLLSRIQERFQHSGDNRGSVAYGLQSTAHIITGAAAIMVAVFGAFALGDMVEMQQMGFGLAVAVFVDATIIRSVLVPASMEMLGAWNWYMPGWLSWLPRIEVEGGQRRPAALPAGVLAEGLPAD